MLFYVFEVRAGAFSAPGVCRDHEPLMMGINLSELGSGWWLELNRQSFIVFSVSEVRGTPA